MTTSATEALYSHNRILITGDAGSGKTTLLRALAIRAARGEHRMPMENWNSLVPFYLPLRAYGRTFPEPRDFAARFTEMIDESPPDGWVHERLKDGRALLLIDGVDEVAAGRRRREVYNWLRRLIREFPSAKYVLTSRPGAVDVDELRDLEFSAFDVPPMSYASVKWLIRRWHDTLAAFEQDESEVESIEEDHRALVAALESDKRLRGFAQNPLLCALLCALNRDRQRHLPRQLMTIYRAALEMLLERRDTERDVERKLLVTSEQLTYILQSIAYWLTSNGWSDAPVERILTHIELVLGHLPGIQASPQEMLNFLLERTGMIRSPAEGRVDFLHRSFQEFLAAKEAVAGDHIGELIRNAHDDQWRNTIIFSAGHASSAQAEELVSGIIDLSLLDEGDNFAVLSLSCMQTMTAVTPSLQSKLNAVILRLIPPSNEEAADALSFSGRYVIDRLVEVAPTATAGDAAGMIRAAAMIGAPQSLALIADLAARFAGLDQVILSSSIFFDAQVYVDDVLSKAILSDPVVIADDRLIEHLAQLPQLKQLEITGIDARGAHVQFGPAPSTLRHLSFRECDLHNLRQISTWTNLTTLELRVTGRLPELRGLERLINLERLILAFTLGRVVRLPEIAGLANLLELRLESLGGLIVDLEVLKLRTPARLVVPMDAVVLNSETSGVQVVRV